MSSLVSLTNTVFATEENQTIEIKFEINGTLYNLKYLKFYKGKVLYYDNSAFLYVNPLDVDTTFAFELDFLMKDYQNYITYYYKSKYSNFW